MHIASYIIFDPVKSQSHFYYGDYSTPTVPYNTPLVWYACFIFYSVEIIAFDIIVIVKLHVICVN